MKRLLASWALCLALTGCTPPLTRPDDAALAETVERAHSPADTYVQLATEYYKLGNHAVALKKALKAVEKDSNNPDAHLILGLVYEALGQQVNAEQAYRRARALAPRDPYVLNAWGQLRCKQQHYDEALKSFEQALQNPLYDAPWVALSNAGLCAMAAGRPKVAQGYLTRALRRKPRFAPALAAMARISYDAGRYLSTRAYVQRYREVALPTPELLYLSVLAERRLGNEEQARRDLQLLRAEFPDSEQAQRLAE